VYRHRSVSLSNENICCEIREDKIAFCEKTAGLRSGNFSYLNSACSKVYLRSKACFIRRILVASNAIQTIDNEA
jgi:hypothetical protein